MLKKARAAAGGNGVATARSEVASGPEDEIPVAYRPAVIGAAPDPGLWRPGTAGMAVRAAAYTAAVSWPLLGALFEYVNLDDGAEFVSRALPWSVPVAAVSALAVARIDRAVQTARGRVRVREPEDEKPPVPRIVLAGLFAGVCVLAFVVGVLRGVMIDHFGY